MHKLTDSKAAAILGWVLAPLALVDIAVLLIGLPMAITRHEWDPVWSLIFLFYVIPALVFWIFLMVLAYRPCSPAFTRLTWGSHFVFNTLILIFWLGCAAVNESDPVPCLYPLIVIVPVFLWTGYFFNRTFDFHTQQPQPNLI